MVLETKVDVSLTAALRLRLSETEKEQLRIDADLAGLSMSALVRSRYFGKPVIAQAEALIVNELRRLGRLFNHIHKESNGLYSTETVRVIDEIKKCVDRIGRDR